MDIEGGYMHDGFKNVYLSEKIEEMVQYGRYKLLLKCF